MMGSVGPYHITMLITLDQEMAIRALYKQHGWECWIKVLKNEEVTNLISKGFTDFFPVSENCVKDVLMEKMTNITGNTELVNNLMKSDYSKEGEKYFKNVNEVKTNNVKPLKTDCLLRRSSGRKTVNVPKNDMTAETTQTKYQCISNKIIRPKTSGHTEKILKHEESSKLTKSNLVLEDTGLKLRRQQRKHLKLDPVDPKTSKRKPKCQFCDAYINKCVMKRHCLKHHADLYFEFECNDCSAKFRKKQDLWDHRNTVKHEMPKTIPKQSEKRHHTPEEVASIGQVKCVFCHQYYPSEMLLRKHYKFKHKELMPKPTCTVCSQIFENRSQLWAHNRETNHRSNVSQLEFYQCDDCGKILLRYDAFRKHKQFACHVIDEGRLSKMQSVSCDECYRFFKSETHLKRHKEDVHKEAPVMCDVCGLVCKNSLRLGKHKVRHDDNNRKYRCEECGKKFFKKFLLTQHQRIHTKEKPFKCILCDYACAIQPNLRKHLMHRHDIFALADDLKKSKEELLALSGNVKTRKNKHQSMQVFQGLSISDLNSMAGLSNKQNNSYITLRQICTTQGTKDLEVTTKQINSVETMKSVYEPSVNEPVEQTDEQLMFSLAVSLPVNLDPHSSTFQVTDSEMVLCDPTSLVENNSITRSLQTEVVEGIVVSHTRISEGNAFSAVTVPGNSNSGKLSLYSLTSDIAEENERNEVIKLDMFKDSSASNSLGLQVSLEQNICPQSESYMMSYDNAGCFLKR